MAATKLSQTDAIVPAAHPAGNGAPVRRPGAKLGRSPGTHRKSTAPVAQLPSYLLPTQVEALVRQAPHAQARLVMLVQWRAGLRVSEALGLAVPDLDLVGDGDAPTLRVRRGKGKRPRLVPLHPELAAAFRNYLDYSRRGQGPIFPVNRSTVWRWVQSAAGKARELNQLPPGKQVGTHTLRHSAARHWLASGVPINAVSLWLGHANIETTLIYLRLLPDPTGYMDRVT